MTGKLLGNSSEWVPETPLIVALLEEFVYFLCFLPTIPSSGSERKNQLALTQWSFPFSVLVLTNHFGIILEDLFQRLSFRALFWNILFSKDWVSGHIANGIFLQIGLTWPSSSHWRQIGTNFLSVEEVVPSEIDWNSSQTFFLLMHQLSTHQQNQVHFYDNMVYPTSAFCQLFQHQ